MAWDLYCTTQCLKRMTFFLLTPERKGREEGWRGCRYEKKVPQIAVSLLSHVGVHLPTLTIRHTFLHFLSVSISFCLYLYIMFLGNLFIFFFYFFLVIVLYFCGLSSRYSYIFILTLLSNRCQIHDISLLLFQVITQDGTLIIHVYPPFINPLNSRVSDLWYIKSSGGRVRQLLNKSMCWSR